MTDERKDGEAPRGRPLALDRAAGSASETLPPFLAPPVGAPVYYGFQILEDVVVDGFTFGKITDFEAEATAVGDAFVIAPDNSRAGLVWEVSDAGYFHQILPTEPQRWGVWGVAFPLPMTSRENARKNLEFHLPNLKRKWDEWRAAP